ncbi:NADH dehydrogenase (ubiquinone) SGDH subunit isoform X1 [Ptiloglossa arizonensis]
MSDHHVMNIQPSEWSWNETKNWLHFYIFLGIIPISIIVFCANVFIGPATLEPIPEGYIPKQWEYVRSPISRFFAKYLCVNRQEEYEKYLHYVHQSWEAKRIRELEKTVKELIRDRQDYAGFSFRRNLYGKYIKEYRDYLDGKIIV